MSNHLSVTSEGLRSASTVLSEQAIQLTGASVTATAGSKPSSSGAARFSHQSQHSARRTPVASPIMGDRQPWLRHVRRRR